MVGLERKWQKHFEWFMVDPDNPCRLVPKEGAPQEIVDSYNLYCEQFAYYRELEKKRGPQYHIL